MMIGMLALLALLLLMVVFRSIAIPLKAAAMNLLSMGAARGAIVAVYQWGWLTSIFGGGTRWRGLGPADRCRGGRMS
jgi:RND superfamily putative drug exporter